MKPTALLTVLAFLYLAGPFPPTADGVSRAFGPAVVQAQAAAAAKKPITHDVYDSWKSIQGTKISADGTWIAYALTPQEGDGELVLRNLKTNAEIRAPRGRDPLITSDNAFVVFAIAPLKKDVDQARKAKRKPEDMPKNGVGIVNLATGQATTVAEHVKSFRVPDDTPKIVVYLTVYIL